jgi:hypothetical protein
MPELSRRGGGGDRAKSTDPERTMNVQRVQDIRDRPAKLSIRMRINRELRAQLIAIQDGPAPSSRWENMRKGRVQVIGTMTRVIEDAHEAGYAREHVRNAVVTAAEFAVSLVYDGEPKRAA